MEISVILPIYNEVENITPLLEEIEPVLNGLNKSYEVIAVDDGSTDGSTKLIEQLTTEKAYLKAVIFRKNAGQTAAFDAGFRAASGKVIVTMDSDRQNDPKDIPPMLAKLDEGYDFVSGWRKNRKDNVFIRTIPSKIANFIIRRVTKTKINDMGCSLKVYKKEITDDLRLYGEMHRFLSVLVEQVGARVGEHVVNHRARVAGVSKYGLSRTVKVVLDLLTIRFMQQFQTKPIYIFGGVGLLLIFFSVVLTGVISYQKLILDIWVHKNPLFILMMMFAVIGVQFIGMGLISELVVRTYFESQGKPTFFISKTIGFANSSSTSSLSSNESVSTKNNFPDHRSIF